MSEPFNGLLPDQLELLALLLEEMGEAIQAIGKIQRHGYASVNPLVPRVHQITNRHQLENELGHVKCAISLMVNLGDLNEDHMQRSKVAKSKSIGQWLHHNNAAGVEEE